MAQAYTGLGEHLRPAGEPPAGSLMTLLDVLGGLVAAEGILAGLIARHRTGRGQRVDSSLLSAAGVLQASRLEGSGPWRPQWTELDVPIAAADGHLVVGAGTQPAAICHAFGAADLASAVETVRGLPTDEGIARLSASGVTAAPVPIDLGVLVTDPTLSHLLEVEGCAFVRPPWRFAS